MPELVHQRLPNNSLFMRLWLTIAIVLTALYFLLPAGSWIFVVASCAMLALGAISLVFPVVLLYFVLLTCVLSSILRYADSFKIGNTEISLSGLEWIWVAAIVLLVFGTKYREVRFRGPFFPLLVFSGWVALRWIGVPSGVGLRDVLFYTLPPLIAVYTVLMLSGHASGLGHRIEVVLLCSAIVPLIVYATCIPLGLIRVTDIGPEGIMDPRTTSEYLLVVLSIAVARWRYEKNADSRKLGLVVALICLITIILSLSRTAAVVGLLLFAVAKINAWQFRKLIAAVLITGVLVAIVVQLFPAFRSRFFTGPEGIFSDQFPYINTEGRAFFWAVTGAHALERPILGWGPGTARLLVGAAIPDSEYEEYHPHNEYLQVFHDLGVVGLLLMLWAWLPLLRRYWTRWRLADASCNWSDARWNMASLLGVVVVLLNSVTGNPLHEAFIVSPVLVVCACASYTAGES